MKKKDYLKNWFIFNFLFHNSHDKFDIQIFVLESNKQNRIMNKQRCCAWVQKEFVITKAQTHGPGYGTVCQCSEPRERKTIRRWFKENVKAKRERMQMRDFERGNEKGREWLLNECAEDGKDFATRNLLFLFKVLRSRRRRWRRRAQIPSNTLVLQKNLFQECLFGSRGRSWSNILTSCGFEQV